MSEEPKIIFQARDYYSRPYVVEYQVLGGYRWERDGSYSRKSSAIYRAEALSFEAGISEARVVKRVE